MFLFTMLLMWYYNVFGKRRCIDSALAVMCTGHICWTFCSQLCCADNDDMGNDGRPWVVPQSIKWLSTITRERKILLDPESGGIPHLFGTFLSPHIGNAWRACHDNNNNNDNMIVTCTRTVRYGLLSVRAMAPQIWNTLPSHLKNISSSREQFKSGLKTWLFVQAWS